MRKFLPSPVFSKSSSPVRSTRWNVKAGLMAIIVTAALALVFTPSVVTASVIGF